MFGILSVDILSVRHFVCSTYCLFDILSVDILSVDILSAHRVFAAFNAALITWAALNYIKHYNLKPQLTTFGAIFYPAESILMGIYFFMK